MVVDSIHNNPVMNVFVYLLSLSAERAKRKPVEQQLQHSSGKYDTIIMCILSVFVVVVLTAVKKITTTKYYTDTDLHIPLEVTTSQGGLTSTTRAKKRWQLAYTLVRNPDLIELRRRDSIDEKDEESKVEGHANPAYIDDGVELGFPSDKKPTKL